MEEAFLGQIVCDLSRAYRQEKHWHPNLEPEHYVEAWIKENFLAGCSEELRDEIMQGFINRLGGD